MDSRLRHAAMALTAAATLTLAGCAADTGTGSEAGTEADGSEVTSSAPAEDDPSSAPPDDETATGAVYDFTATTLDGETFEGSSLAGAPAVLWFWAPWCPTCIMQIPTVTSLATDYGDDVQVVGVGGLDDADAIAEMAEENISGITHLVDDTGEVWQHFGMTQQSTFVVLDADGEIVVEGSVPEGELESVVAELAG